MTWQKRQRKKFEDYPEQDERHLSELKAILDEENSNYAN